MAQAQHTLTLASLEEAITVLFWFGGRHLHPSQPGATARKLFGDLAYRSGALGKKLAGRNVLLATERAERRPAVRQQVEVCFATLKRVFGMDDTLAKTLVGLATRIVAKIAAYTSGCYVNRLLGRPQGYIKELWA